MSNIIELTGPTPEQQMIDSLTTQINILRQQLNDDKNKITEDTRLSNQLGILEAGTIDKVEKKAHKDSKKTVDANIKLMKTSKHTI